MTSRVIKQTLVSASVITVAAGILSRPFGFLREAVIASCFGTGSQLDTFLLAITLPELLAVVLYAALPTAVIPALQNAANWSAGRERRLFVHGLIRLGLILTVVAAAIFVVRAELLNLLAPDLTAEAAALGQRMIAILAGIVLFRGLEAYFRGWLHQSKHFLGPALSPFLLNAILLATILVLYDRIEVEALAYGWLAATALVAIYNGLLAFKLVLPHQSRGAAPADLSPLFRLIVLVAVVEFISMAYPAVDRAVAARFLGEGQIAALRYAHFLVQLPPGLLVVAFSLASYPWISDLSAASDKSGLVQLYNRSIGLIVYAMVPAVAGMLWFAPDVVRVAYQRGAFDRQSVELTTSAFVWFSAGLLFYSIYIYQMRYYYARKMMTRVGVILLLMLAFKTIMSIWLAGMYEHRGLALATSLTWTLGMVLMTLDLRRVGGMRLRQSFWVGAFKSLMAVMAAGAVWYWLSKVWAVRTDASLATIAVPLAVKFLAGLITYWVATLLLKQDEARHLLKLARSRFKPDSRAS